MGKRVFRQDFIPVRLSAEQQLMLNGAKGTAVQEMMSILVAVGRALGAADFIPVRSAHVGLSYTSIGPAGVRWLEWLAESGARVRVPTTTNVLSTERCQGVAPGGEDVKMQARALHALQRMGAIASCSCNPFTQGHMPEAGSHVAWSESATAPYVNGILGARSNREGITALASALTGVTPNYGMHIALERRARLIIHVHAKLIELHHFHLLGVLAARRSRGKIPVITGIPPDTDAAKLYGLCAGFASYCSLPMLLLEGISVEAPTYREALCLGLKGFEDVTGVDTVEIGEEDISQQAAAISGYPEKGSADIAIIGCPHASLEQIREISTLIDGKSVRAGKALLIHTNKEVHAAAERQELLRPLRTAGVTVTRDTCAYVSLSDYPPRSRILSNSAKMVHLMSARGYEAAIGSTWDCILAVTQ